MNTAEAIKIFLLGMIAAFLGVIALRPNQTVAMAATGGVGKAGDLIAVTGQEKSALYLIDPVNKYVAQYATDNARFSLRGARYFKNDLFIKEANKKGGIPIKEAKKLAKESMEGK